MTVDSLEAFGMRRMDGDDIERTLSSESVGVLGVPTDGAPMLRPLSYWFDGEDALYFVYVLGGESEKQALSDQAGAARFLVYNVEAQFNWRSVLLTGTIGAVSAPEREALEERMDVAWQPELFERAAEARRDAPRTEAESEANRGGATTAIYRFDIDDRAGIKQLELPPELRAPDSSGRLE
ncbi:pyridoxamine 5'-phosphate oxidase family protein [Haloarcula salinisoli]|uniref:Pyridoxamine 5'-phosphate oxidase family protein n=1 Tax=Haloarcula salinisoli TaxID=2487746 RepID=A0A8J8CD14_9EURY|nr:pyridoxamine 5'-phosphate oxidase family protein [Halomicroarcula salinisoli]MBX0286893.1 pyridoxamine 5'-phosphate oxidase family protein [Halomicroarcula salinisoli]MBX0304195.1 pyridoxamine 5'-phosphate oxidase family protein [Halomicroarcula salinisoli]